MVFGWQKYFGKLTASSEFLDFKRKTIFDFAYKEHSLVLSINFLSEKETRKTPLEAMLS